MPSRPVALLIVVLTAAALFGALQLDLEREVPRMPPEILSLVRGGRIPPEILDDPASVPAEAADGVPAAAEASANGEAEPTPAPTGNSKRRLITDLALTKVAAAQTRPVDGTREDQLLIRVRKDGALYIEGIAAGTYEQVGTAVAWKVSDHEAPLVVIVPDREAEWQTVYWALETAREAGTRNLGIGGHPDTDREKTLLAMIPVPQAFPDEVAVPEDIDPIEVMLVDAGDGKVTYEVYGQKAETLADLFQQLTEVHGEHEAMYGADYESQAATTPWVVVAPGNLPAHQVIRAIEAIRTTGVETLRFGGEFPPRPR